MQNPEPPGSTGLAVEISRVLEVTRDQLADAMAQAAMWQAAYQQQQAQHLAVVEQLRARLLAYEQAG